MKIHKNNSNNDWCFGNSQADFLIDNNLGVAQNIKTKLQEWKYNFFANLEAGINYRLRLGKRGERQNLDFDIQTIIASVEEVVSITKYESLVNDRVLNVNFSVYTIYSEYPIDMSVEVKL